ncbi:tRNA-dihydrouridine(20) synthase [NAD(P)+]-like [Trichogramma pretiosum]|uniref:tRNA-dihydrouridine(20) synthase [NAD(P)+]-like n=1 Tax=Trichogramma pretiosum TaxID=7493 RepID=UPI0006C94AFC|nr:tRNA-dihydrouridine(20) synthase [NAD(P)+]-like [Trichogramma pretiosum]
MTGDTLERRERLSYADKIIMAPMVRIGTLPMRLLALEYGADIVYTEELIDWKLLRSTRKVNDVLKTIDYIDKTDGTIIFRTSPLERSKVVLQLGTSDAKRALTVAKLVENDVAGIDINMGCPKKFSILGGMGAALLKQPEKAADILKTLVDGLSIPVTCKVRVFEDVEKSIELCKKLAATGISAIAVHGRTPDERPQHRNRNETLKKICASMDIPVIANGGSKEIEKYKDILQFKKDTGCSSVMIARAAEWNCSIFRSAGLLPIDEVIKSYLKLACDYDNSPSNTKYCIQNILRELQETPLGKRFLDTQTLEQICELWDMGDYCRAKAKEFSSLGYTGRFDVVPERLSQLGGGAAKRKLEEEAGDVLLMRCKFIRNSYPDDQSLPKSQLNKWTRENRKKLPSYTSINEDKLFRAIVVVDGKKYGSTFWEKSKKWAEQGAALVGLCALGVIDEATLTNDGNLLS